MNTIRLSLLAASFCTVFSTAGMACIDVSGMPPGQLGDYAGHDGVNVSGLDADFQSQLSAMFAAAEQELGGRFEIYSGHRSVEHQQRLWDAKLAETGGNVAEARKWVAPPGSSMHNYGGAVDIRFGGGTIASQPRVDRWLADNAARFGLTRPMGYEPWHVEPIGGRERLKNGGQTAEMAAQGCDPTDLDLPEMALMNWLAGYSAGQMPPGSF